MANSSTKEQAAASGSHDTTGVNASRTKAACDGITGFPMPPNLIPTMSLPRPKRREATEPRFPFPVPNGWFAIAHVSEIAPEQTKALYYFGRDLVLLRTADGTTRLMDAYCPHLGAHLAAGGRIEGDAIRCPFHGWLWDTESGACKEIPYRGESPLPKKAQIRTYPTMEKNQLIWAWHHAHGEPPSYDIPEVPELTAAGNLPVYFHSGDVATCCQEIVENAPDFRHDAPVHGEEALPEAVDAYSFTTEGACAVTKHGPFLTQQFGLSFNVGRCQLPNENSPVMTMVTALTPIDREHVTLRALFTGPEMRSDTVNYLRDFVLKVFNQDIPIWENKIFRVKPLLLPQERPIAQFRKWALQFYSDYEQPQDRQD